MEDDLFIQEELPLHPPLTTRISHHMSNQGNSDTCFAHSVARVFLKYFKTQYLDKNMTNIHGKRDSTIIQSNNKCDDLYLHPEIFCNPSNKKCVINTTRNILEICDGNTYEYLSVLLYMFFYTLIIENIYTIFGNMDEGGFTVSAFTYILSIIYDINIIEDLKNTPYCFTLQPSDCDEIRSLLLQNYNNEFDIYIIGSDRPIIPADRLTLIDNVLNKSKLYLTISMNGGLVDFKTKHLLDRKPIPSKLLNNLAANHTMTVVNYNKRNNIIVCKNSWGKSATKFGLIQFNLAEISNTKTITFSGLSPILTDTLYSLVIRGRQYSMTDFLNSVNSEYVIQNYTSIQSAIKFVIHSYETSKEDMFLELLRFFDDKILIDNQYTIFTYICLSFSAMVNPIYIRELLRLLFEYYISINKKISKQQFANTDRLIQESSIDSRNEIKTGIEEIIQTFKNNIVESEMDESNEPEMVETKVNDLTLDQLWNMYSVDNHQNMWKENLRQVFDYYTEPKSDETLWQMIDEYNIRNGYLEKASPINKIIFKQIIQEQILDKRNMAGKKHYISKKYTRRNKINKKMRSIKKKHLKRRQTKKKNVIKRKSS